MRECRNWNRKVIYSTKKKLNLHIQIRSSYLTICVCIYRIFTALKILVIIKIEFQISGTMGGPPVVIADILPEKGKLYSFEKGNVTSHVNKIGIANGIAFNVSLKKMYYIDSRTGTVDEYDFDIASGKICK